MRFKLNKNMLKYYGYAVLGVITIIVFYKVLDNFGIILTGIGNTVKYLIGIFEPIIIGALVAYFLFRPMRWIERRFCKYSQWAGHHPKRVRLLSIIIVYLITFAMLALFLGILIPSIVDSVISLARNMPYYMDEVDTFLKAWATRSSLFENLIETSRLVMRSYWEMKPEKMLEQFFGKETNLNMFTQIGNYAMVFAKGTTTLFIDMIAVFFSGIYLMLDKEKIGQQLDRFNRIAMSSNVYKGYTWVVQTIDDVFYRYFAGKIMTSALIGLICYLGLLILQVDYAPLIALIVGVTNVIPYFGPIVGAVPGIVLTLLYNPFMAIWVALWILIVQQFDGNVLGPNVLGRIVELNPFWVLFSVIVGGNIAGPAGMFVAIPFFAVIRTFLDAGLTRWETYKLNQKAKVTEEAEATKEAEATEEITVEKETNNTTQVEE